ncbi:MAG: DUF885 family protein [Sphingomonadales bacterium]|nr:DUF885 family protein [Sphingomonadales bacterium]MDE2168390.1 DUF885 family protein [Sphingomonadales bacterium]
MSMRRRAVLGGVMGLTLAGFGERLRAVPAARPDLRAALDAAEKAATPDAALALLAPFGEGHLTETDRLDLRAARAGLAIDAQLARRFPHGVGLRPYRVTPRDGAWRGPSPEAIDAETRALTADAQAGIVLPRVWLERLITAIEQHKAAGPALASALGRQADLLASLRPQSPARQGLGQLPQGERWFALLAARPGGAIGSLSRCEQQLAARRDALHREAGDIFARMGVRGETVGVCFRQIWQDPAWLYSDDAQGRAQAVADMTHQLAFMRGRLGDHFGPLPAWCVNASVRALSAQEMAAGHQGYRAVPRPGAPGAYIVDLKTIRLRPRWSLPAVVAHELLPGHMIQLGMEGLHPPHPLRRRYASSFVEGWAIYAEQLAAAEGAYPDILSRLGSIHWDLFHICRGLVDLGIHLHGWSHEEARARLEDWQGVAAYFAPFDTDLDRIALEPGVRLADAMAALAIRDRAALRQGDSLRAFHRTLVENGSRRSEDLP